MPPSQEQRHAGGHSLDRQRPVTGVVAAEFQIRRGQDGRMRGVAAHDGRVAVGLLDEQQPELRVLGCVIAQETVPHEVRRLEAALPERGRCEIVEGSSGRGGKLPGEPLAHAGHESSGKALSHDALAPAAQTRVRVRGAQIHGLAGQAARFPKLADGQVAHFTRDDQGVGGDHHAGPASHRERHRLHPQVLMDAGGRSALAGTVPSQRHGPEAALLWLVAFSAQGGGELGATESSPEFAEHDVCGGPELLQAGGGFAPGRQVAVGRVIHGCQRGQQHQQQQCREAYDHPDGPFQRTFHPLRQRKEWAAARPSGSRPDSHRPTAGGRSR